MTTDATHKDASKMELADFKKMLHAQMQDTLMDQYADYLESVKMSNDPEVKRKCVAMHISTIGAEHKEKVDPGANLPVFNFTFSSTGMTATQMPTAERVDTVADQSLAVLDFEHLDLMAPWED